MRRGLGASLLAIVLIALALFGIVVATGKSPRLALDLQGGTSVVLHPTKKVSNGTLSTAQNIIRNRVDALGVSEPEITTQGGDIVVALAGVKNPRTALQVVGQTAQLLFRPVTGNLPPEAKPSSTTTTTASTTTTTAAGAATTAPGSPATTTTTAPTTSTTAKSGADVPTTASDQDDPAKQVVLPSRDKTVRYVLGPAELKGNALKSAKAGIDQNTGQWLVNFTLTGQGSKDFDALAQRNYQKQVAIDLDGIVQSAPTINSQNFNGQGQISGSFSEKEAKNLALVLRYGALPVQLTPLSTQTVSASLGKDSLRAGIVAGVIGLLLVLIYMILYYRALGLVVLFGITVSGMLLYAIISLLGSALSLSGATGIIVSVGVTVDSYVVYFERLKDEIRSGKTIRSSVDRGFSRAYRTILAADLVSLIAAVLLFYLTVGSVRGFAFFLGLSTALDLVTAYFFTRPMVILLGRNRLFTEARFFGVARGLAAAPAGGEG